MKWSPGVKLKSIPFNYDLIFYKSDVVRIHQYIDGKEDTNPYAVIREPSEVQFDIIDSEKILTIKTSDLKVEINKATIECRFMAVMAH